ncbi:MAG: protein kinase, partial [Gallionella sp.]|nr:protein kinase [Gallionella sp.]
MDNSTVTDLVRICPICGKHNQPDETFCACGTLLSDVDFTHLAAEPAASLKDETVPQQTAKALVICPFADCAQPNPHGSQRCVYCNRPIKQPEGEAADEQQSFLPPSLRARFRVIEMLPTAGGQADLALAQSAQQEKRVIKLYRKGIKPDWQVLERLPASNHLVKFFEHGVAEDTAYEVMEYCAEGSLRRLLDGGPQPSETLRRLIEQFSATLAALHKQQILHRDLKPENILLRQSHPLQIALTDFGASTLKMATQYFTGGARTAHYAAPEVLTGVLDEKSDWWSFGMILLEAVTGRHPYAGLSEQVALHQLATQSVEVTGVFDDALRMLCRGLLLRNPKKRWGASEVARWLAGDESLVMPEDGSEGPAVKPYTLGRSQCVTRVDLALALARYWEDGKKDLMRGTIMNWVEQDLRDFNLARNIHDVMIRRDLSDDARLLRVIVSALPGIPPIWKGTVITQETLVRSAAQAVDGNLKAQDWLSSIYKENVLNVLGECGNADMTRISKEWNLGVETYRSLWEQAKALEEEWRRRPRAHAGEVADIDHLMYLAPIRMNVPSLNRILPDLVLSLYVPAFS